MLINIFKHVKQVVYASTKTLLSFMGNFEEITEQRSKYLLKNIRSII